MSEVRLESLRKEFKEVVAVKDVSITFPDAQVTCLLGPSGCGKTTLLRMIAGLENPTSGDIYFGKQRVTTCRRASAILAWSFSILSFIAVRRCTTT